MSGPLCQWLHKNTYEQRTVGYGRSAALDNAQFNLVLAGTEQVPVTTSPASVPLTRGVAILLVPAKQGVFGEQGLSTIVSELNSWGWFTLVMPAPF